MSRSIEQILESIKLQFKDTVLENAANSKGNLYSLIRGMAIASYNQEQVILELLNSRLVTSAIGADLDLYANNYGLIRRQGNSSFGSVIIKSTEDLELASRTLLQTQNGLLTFQTINPTKLPANKEITVDIVSISKTFEANLSAQSVLVAPQYPKLFIQVGKFRDTSNNIIGGLNGGSSPESDNSLRERLSNFVNNKGIVTLPSIRALAQNYVSDVYFVEGRPAAGYTTLYVNTQDQLTIDLLINKLNEIRPVGTLLIVEPIQYQQVDITVEITYTNNINDSLTVITNSVKQAVNIYFNSLSIGDKLIINELSSFISSFTGYINRIVKPSNDLTPLISEYLLIPNEVKVNVKSK